LLSFGTILRFIGTVAGDADELLEVAGEMEGRKRGQRELFPIAIVSEPE
jgi:hypothetical protein